MFKVEAFSYGDHAMVRITGICEGKSHEGPRCEGHSLVKTLDVGELEDLGAVMAVTRILRGALEAEPLLADYIWH